MKALKPLLTGSFLFLATQLSAQETQENIFENLPESKQDIVLRSDELTIIRIIADGEKNDHVNNIVVVCPIIPLTKIFSENGAVVFASRVTGQDLKESLKKQEIDTTAILESGRGDQGIPFINFSYVDTGGKISPTYTFNQIMTLVDDIDQGRLTDTGASMKGNKDLIKNIAKHVEDFCFSAG